MKVFSGYMIIGKRKKNVSLKDIDIGFQTGSIGLKEDLLREMNINKEKLVKISISIVKKKVKI